MVDTAADHTDMGPAGGAGPAHALLAENWPPDLWGLTPAWQNLIRAFWAEPQGQALAQRMAQALRDGALIYPPQPFRALALTPLEEVKVVILGQDPYHGAGQAEGLAFSVGSGHQVPPSLRNIFKEIQRDCGRLPPWGPEAGSLRRWAGQGVLLLNTVLTVAHGQPASHARWGWEALTDALLRAVAAGPRPVVFMLWGGQAQAKSGLIEALNADGRHAVFKSNHPSPLSALRPPTPFMGCGHFGQVNRWLEGQKKKPILW